MAQKISELCQAEPVSLQQPPIMPALCSRADHGVPGQGSDMHGANAKDLIVKVPPGTIVRRRGAPEGEPPLHELLKPGQRALVAAGGRGGRGNLAFKSSRNTAPALAEFGEKVGGRDMQADDLRFEITLGGNAEPWQC
jgi:GTPase involved in cell partitioning and DNA repair